MDNVQSDAINPIGASLQQPLRITLLVSLNESLMTVAALFAHLFILSLIFLRFIFFVLVTCALLIDPPFDCIGLEHCFGLFKIGLPEPLQALPVLE